MFASLGGCCPTLSEAKPCEPSKATADRTKTLELFICVSPFMVFCGALHGVGTTVILILHGDPHPGTVSHSSQWSVYIGERDVSTKRRTPFSVHCVVANCCQLIDAKRLLHRITLVPDENVVAREFGRPLGRKSVDTLRGNPVDVVVINRPRIAFVQR